MKNRLPKFRILPYGIDRQKIRKPKCESYSERENVRKNFLKVPLSI